MISFDDFFWGGIAILVSIKKEPPSFAKQIHSFARYFFPPIFFLVFWKREIFLSKKNLAGKKYFAKE
jgi:hypothetical protein